ncbi:MAG: AAA family ATPase [Chloroflexota bacterium]
MERVAEISSRIVENVERVIVGKRDVVELALIGLICQGHLLVEDVPGVGKTMLAKAFAKSIGCTFRRIQFTPDLLPSDVTGVSVFNQKTGEFSFRPGPVMAQIVLADEINRATPKTQSSLLECMEEHQITVDGVTYRMPVPFMVMATQNPIEYEGTFPLPEAQLDRFLMRIRLGYPLKSEEMEILTRQKESHPIDSLEQVVTVDELVGLQHVVRREVEVSPLVREYIVAVASGTRQHPEVYLGASPRGSLALYHAAQARAALSGRTFAIPDDIKALAAATLAHRVILTPSARIRNVSPRDVVGELLDSIGVPGAAAAL